jgi:hypothetical protein
MSPTQKNVTVPPYGLRAGWKSTDQFTRFEGRPGREL